MEQYVLSLLENISLDDTNVFNGSLLTCKESFDSPSPCLKCIACKLMIVIKFCASLLNHMTDQEIIVFVHDCIGANLADEIVTVFECLLCPLQGKDRIYSQSRARPSLYTDIMDLSLKNHTVSKQRLQRTTSAISTWIAKQPHTFKLQFLVSLLSRLKLVVLAEVHRSINHRERPRVLNEVSWSSGEHSGHDADMEPDSSHKTERTSNNVATDDDPVFDSRIDFISMLPVHISKYILNLLNEESLKICSSINDNWKTVVSQVRKEDVVNQKIREQSMLLQEVSTKPIDPNFARDADVPVPRLKPGSHEVIYNDGCEDTKTKRHHKRLSLDNSADAGPIPISREIFNMDIGYKDVLTKNVIMEERNVYCGAYSVLLVKEGIPKQTPPATRTISYNSGELIAVSGSNKIIQFLDIEGRKTNTTRTKINGHAGSIKVLRIIKKSGQTAAKIRANDSPRDEEVLSGSYDTTIRRWDLSSGKCIKIYIGHSLTINALDVRDNIFASGSMDGTCKLWDLEDGKSILTMKHNHSVTAVAISLKLCVSGDVSGTVKVWNIQNGSLIKNLVGHSKEISAVRVDSFHILSASLDCYVLLWSSVGEFDTCIGCFRHPKPVLCMEMVFMRAITGSSDGRIRIWNILTGQCLRIIRGNSRSDPVLTMVVIDNRIVINTVSNILVLNFETVQWIYANDEEKKPPLRRVHVQNTHVDVKSSPSKHSYQRYERARYAGNIDPRIFLSPVTIRNDTPSTASLKSNKESTVRMFDNGMPLNRASAWLVTPSLSKSVSLPDKSPNFPARTITTGNCSHIDQIPSISEEGTRAATNSSSGRRISYGFERQDHLKSDVELKEMKNTLRKHIRSIPLTAAQAMPDFVKTMVSQMRESASTGRPISAFSSLPLTRRSSGPVEVDLRSKLPAEDIRNALNPSSPPLKDSSKHTASSNSPACKFTPQWTPKESTSKSNIVSSARSISNRAVVDNFFVPKKYKDNLSEMKSEFNKRQSEIVGKARGLKAATNLNLKTYEYYQEQLKEVDRIKCEYETSKLLSQESQRHENWLKKATNLSCPTYEKDVVRRRPRSAKM